MLEWVLCVYNKRTNRYSVFRGAGRKFSKVRQIWIYTYTYIFIYFIFYFCAPYFIFYPYFIFSSFILLQFIRRIPEFLIANHWSKVQKCANIHASKLAGAHVIVWWWWWLHRSCLWNVDVLYSFHLFFVLIIKTITIFFLWSAHIYMSSLTSPSTSLSSSTSHPEFSCISIYLHRCLTI